MHILHGKTFNQRMDLGRRHRHRRRRRAAPRRHRREGSRDQPFEAQPETTVLPDQHFQLLPIPTQEEKTVARVRLVPQFMLNHAGERVDPPPHVLRPAGHVDPPHRREVQHRPPRRPRRHANAVARTAAAKSAGTPAANVQRTPLRDVMTTSRR
jgi:hypothetical protein